MNNKLKIGLLLLVMALVAAPGASAQGHPGGTMPAPTDGSQITTSNVVINGGTYPGCASCHPVTSFCGSCHSYPVFTLSILANPTTVTAGISTPETLTVSGSNNVKNTKTPSIGATITLSGPGVSISGTSIAGGIFATTVNPAGIGTINAIATKTGFNQGTAAITVTNPTPVLRSITLSPATTNLNTTKTQVFTATALDQNGAVMQGVTITFSSSNGTVGNVAPLTATTGTAGTATTTFTAGNPGSATVKAANGLISGTATVTVNAQTPVLPAPVLRSITLTPATTNLNTTKTQVFTATALDQNGDCNARSNNNI